MKYLLRIGGLAIVLIFGLATAVGAITGLSLTPTAATFVIPAGGDSTYTMNLWHTGTLEGSVSGTEGTLVIPVPAVKVCAFQVDIKRDGVYVGGTHKTMPTCGPETTTTTTTSTTTTTQPAVTTTTVVTTVPPTVPPATVPPAPPAPPVVGTPAHASAPAAPASLAFTGVPQDTGFLVALALGMLLMGAVFLIFGRRRSWR